MPNTIQDLFHFNESMRKLELVTVFLILGTVDIFGQKMFFVALSCAL